MQKSLSRLGWSKRARDTFIHGQGKEIISEETPFSLPTFTMLQFQGLGSGGGSPTILRDLSRREVVGPG